MRDPVSFQSEDWAVMESVAEDATLLASLTAITSGWRGFTLPLEEVDTTSPVAAAGDGFAVNPAVTGTYRLGYGTDLQERRSLEGQLLSGLPAILYLTLVVQPHTAFATILSLSEAIRTRFAAVCRASSVVPNESVPLARGSDIGTWSTWPMILRART